MGLRDRWERLHGAKAGEAVIGGRDERDELWMSCMICFLISGDGAVAYMNTSDT